MFWLQLSANICTRFVDFHHQQMFNETCLFDWSLLTPRLSALDWKLTNWPPLSSPCKRIPYFFCHGHLCKMHRRNAVITEWGKEFLVFTLLLELARIDSFDYSTTQANVTPFPIINTECWLSDPKKMESWEKTLIYTITAPVSLWPT